MKKQTGSTSFLLRSSLVTLADVSIRSHDKGTLRRANVVEFRGASQPALNPSKVAFTAVTDTPEGLVFRVEYTFQGQTVCVKAEIAEPRRPPEGARVALISKFPVTYDMPPAMPMEERIRITQGAYLEARSRGEKPVRYTFYDSIHLTKPFDDGVISGPWGARTLRLSADNRRDGVTTLLRNYPGNTLSQGYHFGRAIMGSARAGSYCVTIE